MLRITGTNCKRLLTKIINYNTCAYMGAAWETDQTKFNGSYAGIHATRLLLCEKVLIFHIAANVQCCDPLINTVQ